jgi:hypothetical protein
VAGWEVLRLGESLIWSRLVAEVGALLPDVVQAVGAEVIRCLPRSAVTPEVRHDGNVTEPRSADAHGGAVEGGPDL